jgi:hypothetical protein
MNSLKQSTTSLDCFQPHTCMKLGQHGAWKLQGQLPTLQGFTAEIEIQRNIQLHTVKQNIK